MSTTRVASLCTLIREAAEEIEARRPALLEVFGSDAEGSRLLEAGDATAAGRAAALFAAIDTGSWSDMVRCAADLEAVL